MEIQVLRKVLDANDTMAKYNRKKFQEKNVYVINIMSSPGSGKTTLLEKTLERLEGVVKSAVIVGDICTSNDADRLSKTGVPVIQINTDEFGGDCHLGAHVIDTACEGINLDEIDLLIVENVGNLVCPAEFDIGENIRVVVLSTTEGEDKPEKYPLMFRVCQTALINKIDLVPYLDYDLEKAEATIRRINPEMEIIRVSAKSGEGFDLWIDWLKKTVIKI